MRSEIENIVVEIHKSLELLKQRMDWDTAEHRMEEFDAMSENPDLWNNPEKAQKLMRERQMLSDSISNFKELSSNLQDNIELIELGEIEEDEVIIKEAENNILIIQQESAKQELEALLNGEVDSNDTFLQINAGAGFLVVLTGNIMRMPGLPKVPAANNIKLLESGVIEGLE